MNLAGLVPRSGPAVLGPRVLRSRMSVPLGEERSAAGDEIALPPNEGHVETDPAEESLVSRLKAGDEQAFADLVRQNAGRLLAAARRLLRSEESARDAVQEAFLKVHQSIAGFAGNARLSTWIHRILINVCLMKLRSQRRHPEEPIEVLLPKFPDGLHQEEPQIPWEDDALARLERAELRALVRQTIERLPETYRTVLLLRDIEELDTAEVARLLHVTENAVKIRLHRARQALRTLLDPHFKREPL